LDKDLLQDAVGRLGAEVGNLEGVLPFSVNSFLSPAFVVEPDKFLIRIFPGITQRGD
jgi:hypothetical protein